MEFTFVFAGWLEEKDFLYTQRHGFTALHPGTFAGAILTDSSSLVL